MPSPYDFAQELNRGSTISDIDNIAREYLNLIKTLPIQEAGDIIIGLKFSPLIDVHDTESISGFIGEEADEFVDHTTPIGYKKVIPNLVHSDPLSYDESNATGLRFNQPDKAEGTRFGGAAFTDGSSNIIIPDNPFLNPSDAVILAFWVYLPNIALVNSFLIFKGNNTDPQNSIFLLGDPTPRLLFQLDVGGVETNLLSSISKGVWHHVVALAKSGQQELWIDNVLVDTDSKVGSLGSSTFDYALFSNDFGGQFAQDGVGLAWLSIINGFPANTTQWVNDDFNGIRDVSTFDEIICYPFMNDLRKQPPMTSGLFASG